jgi:ABC-type branched-subunit amino acid transport system ATPase component
VTFLRAQDVQVARGGTPVIHAVSLEVGAAEAVSLLGRNGMGKTTFLRALIGLERVTSGSVVLDGTEVTGRAPHVIARMGLGYVPQGRGIFPDHSVEQNLTIGLRKRSDTAPTFELTNRLFPVLGERSNQRAGTLSGGEQQMLAIARCLALRPRLLLLDEPTEGLQPSVVQLLRRTFSTIREELGVALLLVEQNLDFAFDVTDRGYVLEKGEIAASGTTAELRHHAVIKEYLAV